MDYQEANAASAGEVEVGGDTGPPEETLAKQQVHQQAEESHNNLECELPKLTLSESSLSSLSFSSAKSRLSTDDGGHDTHENGEIITNGESQIQEGSPTITSTTSPPICNSFDIDQFHGDDNEDRSDDEANFEVSELINEILHQSSYLDDGGLNGLEFVDTLPDALDGGSVDLDVTSSVQELPRPVFLNRKDERASSPDSDSSMTTASEGSSSSTSQLSAASTHTTDLGLHSFLRSESRELLSQLLSSSDMSEIEFKTQIGGEHNFDMENLEVLSLTVPSSTIEKLRALDPINGLGILEIEANSVSILEVDSLPELKISQSSNERKNGEDILPNIGKEDIVNVQDPIVESVPQDERESPTTTFPVASPDSTEVETIIEKKECNDTSETKEKIDIESGDLIENLDDLNLAARSLIKEGSKFMNDIGETLAALETLSLDSKEIEENACSTVNDFNQSTNLVEEESEKIQLENGEIEYNSIKNEAENDEKSTVSDTEKADKSLGPSEQNSSVMNGQQQHDCSCKRSEVGEDGGSVIVGVWAELRSSLRQLHRSMIPQSTQGSAHRSRPSVNRIKALANMLMSHDAHQLYLRISHLAHELCIELKVRLLATIHDNPTPEDAATFIQGVCDSYQWVMSVCEALHPALERLDSEHLSRFKLNWVTLNMHIFHATILTEPDVHDYTNICTQKLSGSPTGEDVIGCLASLHRTLSVAEAVWVRADALLQDYAVERAALSARRRQLLANWEQFKAQQRNHQQEQAAKNGEDGATQCPCNDCIGNRGVHLDNQPNSTSTKNPLSSMSDIRPPSSCECHFCNSSIGPPAAEEPVLPTSSGNSLPPIAQPQLSLYPHIHSTPPGSDIVGTGQSREDVGPVPPPPTTKPPITTNPYLGSDLLTEQLMREWELVYGDALTPPGSYPILPPPDAVLPHFQGDPGSLVSGVETLHINSSRPSYTRTMVDPSLPYVPDSQATARAHTTIHPSSQTTTFTTNHTPVCSSGLKVPSSSSMSNSPSGDSCCSSSCEVPSSAVKCCSATNTTSVITHTRAHHTHTTAAVQKGSSRCLNGLDDPKCHQLERLDKSTSRESIGESDSSGGDEWSSADESDSSATVSSTHQDPHCDCCYCHMLHHKQYGGRQKYSDRRDRLLQILSRKKKARNSGMPGTSTTCPNATGIPTNSSSVPTTKSDNTPLGGENINKILDFIEGNQVDEAKHAKKAAKKARQKQKRMAIRREEEEEDGEDERDDGEYDDEEEEELEYEDDDDDFNDKSCDGEEEDGPLAELRRRAPDVTITVVRPGQQTPRTSASPQISLGKPCEPPQPTRDMYKPQAKMVPSLAQNSKESIPPPMSRTILQPSRPSSHQNQLGNQRQGRSPGVVPSPMLPTKPSNQMTPSGGGGEVAETPASTPGYTGLSTMLKGMETKGNEKEKGGSQMVTIRRVMDPNNAEPTVTITLKGDKPDKDKVLFKLINGQAVSGNNSQGGKGGKKGKKGKGSGGAGGGAVGGGGGVVTIQKQRMVSVPQPEEPPIPEGLSPEEVKQYKKKMKKERQKQKKIQEQMQEQQKGRMQQLELQKQQELLRQQQEQILQKQLALQRQEQELIKQQQQNNKQGANNKGKKKNGKEAKNSNISNTNVSSNKKSKTNNGNNNNTKNVDRVSAIVYDGDDMAPSFNLPPGVTINKVAGQPGMVTISNNMGGAFSQPFLPNPNVYPSPVVQGYPVVQPSMHQSVKKSSSRGQTTGLSWNSALDANYPDKENVIVVDTNNGILDASPTPSSSRNLEMTSEEKVTMAVKGIIDPATLNMTQKKKFKKLKKTMLEEKEKAEQKQKEEDDLMDQMYSMSKTKSSKNTSSKTQQVQVQTIQKKGQKMKETSKQPPQGASSKQAQQGTSVKVNKNTQKTNENQKQKQSQELSRQNSKNISKQIKETNQNHGTSRSRKNSTASNNQSKGKQQVPQQTQVKQLNQQKQSQQLKQQQQGSQHKSQPQKGQPQQQPSSQQKQNLQQKTNSQQKQKQQQQKQAQPPPPQSQQQRRPQQKQKLKQQESESQDVLQQKMNGNQGKLSVVHEKQAFSGGHKPNGKSIGYAPQDIAHEARYAQYLAANANTLAKLNYASFNGNGSGDCPAEHYSEEDRRAIKKRKARKGKKGQLEDMNTIDSVFTPKDNVEGELDETERDVEAFKRFCFNNVPRYTGEKPKVNFNVKDIMIKKRPCNVNV